MEPEPQGRSQIRSTLRAMFSKSPVRLSVTYHIEARVVESNTGLNFLDCYLLYEPPPTRTSRWR